MQALMVEYVDALSMHVGALMDGQNFRLQCIQDLLPLVQGEFLPNWDAYV